MSEKKLNEYKKGRKNLMFASLISIPGPLLLAMSMTNGRSATQSADLIRRCCEFLTIFLAWMVYELTVRRLSENDERKNFLETFIKYFTGFSMCLSGSVMIYVAIAGFGGEKGNVTTSLILAVIGATINARLYFSYKTMANTVLSVQAKLHRVKMMLDCFMTVLLTVWIFTPVEIVKNYADVIGSCSISIYLIWNGIRILKEDRRGENAKQS